MVTTVLTKMQLLDLYPQLGEIPEGEEKPLIDSVEANGDDEDYPDATNSTTMQSFTPDNVKDKDMGEGSEKYRLIEYYRKVRIPFYRVIDTRSGE